MLRERVCAAIGRVLGELHHGGRGVVVARTVPAYAQWCVRASGRVEEQVVAAVGHPVILVIDLHAALRPAASREQGFLGDVGKNQVKIHVGLLAQNLVLGEVAEVQERGDAVALIARRGGLHELAASRPLVEPPREIVAASFILLHRDEPSSYF